MTKKEVDKVFDAIVDFSELEEFIDSAVKFYSSGMYVRLGFAVAVNVDPDILVIDEVLAVGDERFQRKCIDRVKQFQREGRTILLVTHSPDQVRSICDRAVVLSHGNLVTEAMPGEAVRIFREGLLEEEGVLAVPEDELDAVAGRITDGQPDADHPVRITYTACAYPNFEEVPYLSTGDDLTIGVGYHASIATDDVVFSLELRDNDGNCFMRTDTDILGLRFDLQVGQDWSTSRWTRSLARRDVHVFHRDAEQRWRALRLARAGLCVRGDEPGQGRPASFSCRCYAVLLPPEHRRHRADGARGTRAPGPAVMTDD